MHTHTRHISRTWRGSWRWWSFFRWKSNFLWSAWWEWWDSRAWPWAETSSWSSPCMSCTPIEIACGGLKREEGAGEKERGMEREKVRGEQREKPRRMREEAGRTGKVGRRIRRTFSETPSNLFRSSKRGTCNERKPKASKNSRNTTMKIELKRER